MIIIFALVAAFLAGALICGFIHDHTQAGRKVDQILMWRSEADDAPTSAIRRFPVRQS